MMSAKNVNVIPVIVSVLITMPRVHTAIYLNRLLLLNA